MGTSARGPTSLRGRVPAGVDGTDHSRHQEQASMIRRYIFWRNNHAHDERLRRIVDRLRSLMWH
jgi:hypothetical protein